MGCDVPAELRLFGVDEDVSRALASDYHYHRKVQTFLMKYQQVVFDRIRHGERGS